jgi:hypothetical protein
VELELTEDQEFFLATIRRFLATEAPVAWVRRRGRARLGRGGR